MKSYIFINWINEVYSVELYQISTLRRGRGDRQFHEGSD